MELHLDPAVLVGVDLLTRRTDHNGRLGPLNRRPRRDSGRTVWHVMRDTGKVIGVTLTHIGTCPGIALPHRGNVLHISLGQAF